MRRPQPLAAIAKLTLLAACLVAVSNSATACFRRYKPGDASSQESPSQSDARAYLEKLTSGKDSLPTDETVEQLRLEADQGDYRAKSDYAVALASHGDVPTAIEILRAIETEQPREHIIASNFGTALELAGDDRQALEWITKGVRLNPNAREDPEWLHVRILEAKLALAEDPNWLKSHSILGLDFGSAAKPARPRQTVTDFQGQGKTLGKVRAALEDQLHERLSLIDAPDAVVANLLFDLGNILMVQRLPGHAFMAYRLAERYGAGSEPLVYERLSVSRPGSSWISREVLLWLLFDALGLCIAAAVGIYLKQWIDRSRQPVA